MTGQTYEQADAQPIPPLDDRIADLAQKLCDDHRNTLNLFCCDPQKRPAKNLVVQSYYDCTMIWCAEGHGCKHPQAVANKRRREHRNRSLAQQARRAREKTPNVEVSGAPGFSGDSARL